MINPIRKHEGQNIFIKPSEHHSAEHFCPVASIASTSLSLIPVSFMRLTTRLIPPRFRVFNQSFTHSLNHPSQTDSKPSPEAIPEAHQYDSTDQRLPASPTILISIIYLIGPYRYFTPIRRIQDPEAEISTSPDRKKVGSGKINESPPSKGEN